MKEWLETLTEKQIRALACQCGMHFWWTAEVPSLKTHLLCSEQANSIFQDTYGKETSIQE